jgi:predicted RNA-binding Zn ribbon-like protein
MGTARDTAPEFDLSGGILCLDFANTVSKRKMAGETRDDLPNYYDLIRFARDTGMVTPSFAREILGFANAKPKQRDQIFESAIRLREAIFRAFAAIARSHAPNRRDLKEIEGFATEAMKHRQLVSSGGRYRWEWKRGRDENVAYVLWPIAESAADLLTSERATKVRECHASTCAWLFLDESRNHSRRWCDMSVCGNRQKARLHYKKKLSAARS